MRIFALLLLMLTTGAMAKGQEVTVLDCSIRIEEGRDSWEADQYGARWFRYSSGSDYISASIFAASRAEREALKRHGSFDPALGASLAFGPPWPKSKKPVWLALFGGQEKLPPILLDKSDGAYNLAFVSLFDLEPLLAAPELRIYYVLADGSKLYQSSISTAEMRAAIDRFPALVREYDSAVARAPEACVDNSSDNSLIVN